MNLPLFRLLSHGKLTVLLFHKVPADDDPVAPGEMSQLGFEKLLDFVQEHFQVLPLDQAIIRLRAGNLPPGAACITFDDGYADWLGGAVPYLERHGLHATFYVTTGQFSGQALWHERILHAVKGAPASLASMRLVGADMLDLPLQGLESRRQTIIRLDQYLKYQEPDTRERLLQEVEQLTGADPTQAPRMPLEHLRIIHGKGFGIGGHSVTHPILTCCSPEAAYREIAQVREELEGFVRGRVDSFAYPNGLPDKDFTSEHVDMVRRAGYRSALSTHWGIATSQTSVFEIPRFTPWGPTSARFGTQFVRNLFHRARPVAQADSRQPRVLMVAFHFPPQTGSSGILRTLNFVKNLPALGWTPSVLSAHPQAYVERRNDLVGEIPLDTEVQRAFALDAARHLSIKGKYPRLFAVPDRWGSWWLGAQFQGRRMIRRVRPAVIWSTYPISTSHWIAASLARWSGLPWVADFRDPMVSDGYPLDRLQRSIWQRIESRVLRDAAVCVFTTERAAQTYARRYPDSASKCIVIENGYDEAAFECLNAGRTDLADDTLLILHSGLIYPQDRNPSTFFEAVNALLERGQVERRSLRIRFRAPHHDDEVRAMAEHHGLSDVVDVAPPIPYREAIQEMVTADLLLVFQGSNFNAQIPAKIYEYLRAQRPLLAVLDLAGDTAKQLRQFEGIFLSEIDRVDSIQNCLEIWLRTRGTSAADQLLANNLATIQKYSRKAHAERLASVFHRLSSKRS